MAAQRRVWGLQWTPYFAAPEKGDFRAEDGLSGFDEDFRGTSPVNPEHRQSVHSSP